MPRMIDRYLNGVEVRRTVSNWPLQIKAIVDGYRAYTTISHAVQKDAVQNAWSAKKSKKGKDWSLTFELIVHKGKKYLSIVDSGTTGLTGRVLSPDEYELDLPGEERWGRFEGVAFTQPREERTLGSRGRGKFVFVGASKEQTILYDTLRDDCLYRFGFRTIIRTESPVAAYENEEGRRKLLEMTDGAMQPLGSVGTRVIIVDPIDEVISDVNSGKFLRHISETWWEIIEKREADIFLVHNGQKTRAEIPNEFILAEKDTKTHKGWIKENARNPQFQVKKLHLVYNSKKSVPEDLRGVAIQRDGMKICVIEPKYMGREIAERLYGYITLGSGTEEALLEDEGIEHYSYDFRRSLPGAIKRYVEDEMMKLAQEKLGFRSDEREVRRQQQQNAERRALAAANNFAKALGLGSGPGVTRKPGGGGGVEKVVRIQMEEIALPRLRDLRANYGESVDNIRMRIVNNSDKDANLRVNFFLRYFDKPIKTYVEQDYELRPGQVSSDFGPYKEIFTKHEFSDIGKYTIVGRIISLRDEDKGDIIDHKTKGFYLEEDPPMKGMFERCEAYGAPDEEPIKYWLGYADIGSEKGLVLNYNLNHPSYCAVSDDEEGLSEHILRIAAHEMCRYDLLQEESILFKDAQRSDPQEVLKMERHIVGEALYKFRKGEI